MRLLLTVVLTWAEISTLSIIQAVPAAPLHIGNTRQLFLDDFAIGSMENLTRVLHYPQRHSGNPILTGTQSWEKWVIGVNGRSVLYDQESQEFRMWYGGYLIDEAYPRSILFKVCYAVSADGIHWTRPNLGQVDWEGSRRNNILRWGQKWMRRPNVMKDPGDPDPERRFKMTYVDIFQGKTAITKGYSRDGIRWRLNGDEKPWFRGPHSANLLGWDPSLRRYVLYVRMPGFPNSVGRTTSGDFITWSEPQRVLAPEPEEGKHFKGLAAFLYEDLYLGWLWIFYGRRSADAELVLSRDGIHWHRISPQDFFFSRGDPGSWDGQRILPVAPVVHKDRIWIYYSGENLIHHTLETLKRANSGWVENGQRLQRAIGLATLRLDGFASLQAGSQAGRLTTKTVTIPGGSLFVNADVAGELDLEILDEREQPIPGYAALDCVPIRSDSLRHSVRWKDSSSLEDLRGRAAKLRFWLRDGHLYSFWFEERQR